MKRLRLLLGLALMKLGLKAIPPGRSRNDMAKVVKSWGRFVLDAN